jgi:hypothetical protein
MAAERLPTFYDLLQVSHAATADDIRAAYRRLAREHHPDRGGADGDRMARINQAYEVLSDAERRAHYDQALSQRPEPRMPGRVQLPGDRSRLRLRWVVAGLVLLAIAVGAARVTLRTPRPAAIIPAAMSQPPIRPVSDETLQLIPSRSISSLPREGRTAAAPAAGDAAVRAPALTASHSQ